jgi:hypothetical protein
MRFEISALGAIPSSDDIAAGLASQARDLSQEKILVSRFQDVPHLISPKLSNDRFL